MHLVVPRCTWTIDLSSLSSDRGCVVSELGLRGPCSGAGGLQGREIVDIRDGGQAASQGVV